jgi:hypothetical protein
MAIDKPTTLPQHYEKHLGPIARGWSDDKRAHGVQVVSFENQPASGITTFATLGLGRHIINQPNSTVRQELLMSAHERFPCDAIAGLVLSLAELVLRRGKALLRGEVIGPAAPVIRGSTLEAMYVTNPSPFDGSLTEFVSEPATVFAYLIPITSSEATLARERGWRWFEDELMRQDPDIWDLTRTESIGPR